MILFESERLTVREIVESDLNGFYELHSNERVMGLIPTETFNLTESKKEIKKIIERQLDSKSKVKVCAIILKSKVEFVGTYAIINIDENIVEVGYRIREKFWRQGIGTEVTNGMIDFLFNKNSTKKILADVDSKNVGSIKILEKFMVQISESIDEKDNSVEIHFELEKENWLQQNI